MYNILFITRLQGEAKDAGNNTGVLYLSEQAAIRPIFDQQTPLCSKQFV